MADTPGIRLARAKKNHSWPGDGIVRARPLRPNAGVAERQCFFPARMSTLKLEPTRGPSASPLIDARG